MISNELKTIYDPGIPVNIADLIYASKIVPREQDKEARPTAQLCNDQQGVPTRNPGDMAGHVKLATVPGSRANQK